MENKIFDKDFFEKLNTLNINLNFRLSRGSQGGRKSKAKGVSVEFSDFREYTYGDDFRRVDWNAYGRFEKLFVKLFMEEREAIFNIFIDGSKSMDFGQKSKGHVALKIGAVLSYIALSNLDSVNINFLTERSVENFSVNKGKVGFQKLLGNLEKLKFQGKEDIKRNIIKSNLKRNGMSIIISDFLIDGGATDIEEAVKYLSYKKQQVVLIQVLTLEEREPELYGTINLIDCETNKELKISITPKILEEYKKSLEDHNNKLKEVVKKYGGMFIEINSEDDINKIILNDLLNSRLIG